MELIYELWLHCACGFEAELTSKTRNAFAGKRFGALEEDFSSLKQKGVPEKVINGLNDTKVFDYAKRMLNYCTENGIRVITMDSEEYPASLRNIYIPPRVLFLKGKKLTLDNEPSMVIVGCRRPTENGKEAAYKIAHKLAQNGTTVIGGMAEGIDGRAHHGAINAGGKTVAVLAGGVDDIYPQSNEDLYYEILEKGTIISERPPKTKVRKYFYAQRNRIMVGLSRSIMIVEGRIGSGTSITANIATDENRDILAVPGNPVYWQSALPNSLIADGAQIVKNMDMPIDYIKETYPEFFKEKEAVIQNENLNRDETFEQGEGLSQNKDLNKSENRRQGEALSRDEGLGESKNKSDDFSGVNSTEKKILSFLYNCGRVATNEEIAKNCKIAQSTLNSELTMLCIKGKIRQESGGRYVLTT